MRRASIIALLLAAATPAAAQQADQGFTFGLRTGIAFAGGDIAGDPASSQTAKLADDFKSVVPLVLEAGFRFSGVTLGLYYQYGFASLDDQMPLGSGECAQPGIKCDSGRVKRLGVQLTRPFPNPSATPWIGAGLGWEWASWDETDGVDSVSFTYKGLELMGQGGVEFLVSPKFYVGPYASISLARYSEVQFKGGGMSGSVDFDQAGLDEKWHEWFQVGVRARFDL